MNQNMKAATISQVLKEWYTVDSILFNDHARNVIREGSVFKEYMVLKANMLSNLFEYYMHVGIKPVGESISDIKQLQESAVTIARKCKKLSSAMMVKESTQLKIKEKILAEAKALNTDNLEGVADAVIEEKMMQYSLDNALIGLPLLEAVKLDAKCKSIKCKLFEQSHRTYRNSLIHLALGCKKV